MDYFLRITTPIRKGTLYTLQKEEVEKILNNWNGDKGKDKKKDKKNKYTQKKLKLN